MFSNRPKWFFVMAAWLFWLMPAYAYAVDVSLTGIVEEGGNTQVTVQLSGPVPDNGMMSDYTFTWTLMDGSAANKFNSFADFSSYSSTPGMDEKINYTGTSNSFSLPVVDDSANEGTEVGELCISTNDSMWRAGTFTYSTALSYDGSTGTACFSLTLNDNDAPPTIAFNSSSSANSEAVSSVSIPVSLSASWSSTITVNYTVIGTATGGGTDYTLANGMLSFSAGTTSLPIPISGIVDDNIHEGDETVILTLSSPTGATLGTNTVHTYTITENDTLPTLSVADLSNAEGAFGVNAQPNVAVTLSHPSSQSVSFDWSTQDGTATSAGSDYASDNGTLYISAGTTSVNISPVIFGDDNYEQSETFSLVLSNPSNATILDGTGIITLTNDDNLPSLGVSLQGLALEGGGNASLDIALDNVAGVNVSFDYTTIDNTAAAGSEYTATSGTATIAAGAPNTIIQVPLINNSVDNSDKTFTFTISNPVRAVLGTSSETVTIIDDEAVVSINDITVNETDSAATFTVTVQGPMTASTLDVDYTTLDGSAAAGSDYASKSGTLSFASSQAIPFNSPETKTIIVNLSDDAVTEGSESFDVSLSNIVSGGSVVMPDNTGTASITDNDASSVEFNATSSSGAESVSSAALQVDLSNQSASAVTVDYAVTGTATGSGADYTLANGTLTIPANTSSANITIGSIVDDSLVEGNETVIVTLSNPSGATLGTDTVHTYTITDNDVPTISVSSAASASEAAGTHVFTVSLSAPATTALSVDFATSDGTALAGSDYTSITSTLSFAVGDQSKTVLVTILDDSDAETSESFSLTLSNPVNITLGTSTVSVSITDNDSGVDLSLVDEAEKYVRDISDQLAQEKGHDLIEASHRLIRTSLDSIMTKSSVFANKGEGNSQGQSVGFAQITSSTNRQAFFSQPNSAIPDAKTTFNQNLIGAVKSLDVIADGESHHAHFDYDLYTPLIRSNDRLITKIAAQTSKQKDGPEARRLIASFALEKKAGDEQSAIGRFVHLTHENADFNTDYKGDKNTSGVNIGIYKVYTADVDALNSTYISAGISNTDLSLEKSGMLLDSSYLSYQFQTGFSVGRVYIAKRFTGMLEFTLDALYDYQNGHDLNITSGISKFNRLMSGKGHYEIIARFEPKANFEFGETQNAGKRILQVTPLLKCGTGTMTLDCGGGIATKVSSPFEVDKGHISFGIRYEHYRDTDFMEYMMNINQNLFNSDQIKLNTELKVDTNDDPTSSNAGQYALGSSLNVTF